MFMQEEEGIEGKGGGLRTISADINIKCSLSENPGIYEFISMRT
jgi:hypothetical protein